MDLIKQPWQLFSLYEKMIYSIRRGQILLIMKMITILPKWTISKHLLPNFAFYMDL